MDAREQRELLARYINGEVGLLWQENVLPHLKLRKDDRYIFDRLQDILTSDKYKIFSSALNLNTDEGNRRFKQIFNELIEVIYRPGQDQKKEILEKILTNPKIIPAGSWNIASEALPQNNSGHITVKSFSFLKQSISGGKNLELFDYLIRELPQNSRPQIVKDAVSSLCSERSFDKRDDLDNIKNSLGYLIYIINTHSGANNLQANFQKLMGIAQDGSYSNRTNIFFTKEILESFSAEEGFIKMKELLGVAGIADDEQKNTYIKKFVNNFFVEDVIGGDQEKLKKLNHYLKKACNDREDEIFEHKSKIIKALDDKNISYKLDEYFPDYKSQLLDFVSKKTDPITPEEIQNLIIYSDSIKKVDTLLENRANMEDFSTIDLINVGREGVANDCTFLRKVLEIGDKNLLNELIGGSQPLINEQQIIASVNFNEYNRSFQPIRRAFKNQDSSALDCLVLLFSKISEPDKLTILNDLIPLIPQDQDPNQPIIVPDRDNFLTDILSKNLDSARMLIDLANKAGLQDNIKSSLSYQINAKSIFKRENPNYIALLNMIADNGPLSLNFMEEDVEIARELTGTKLFKEILNRQQFYINPESPSILLNQGNPAALALFFEKTGGVEDDENKKMLRTLRSHLRGNRAIKISDACQNSLMFLLTKNPQLEANFRRLLTANNPNNLKKIDDKKLIKAICDSIFEAKEGHTSLSSDFQKLNINPLLEAGKIFQHFDDRKVRDEKTNFSVAFGKDAVIKTANKKEQTKAELDKELSNILALRIIGYKIGENNPLLANDATADLTLKLNEKLLGNGFKPIRKLAAKVPATAVDPTETNAVSPTQGNTPNL